MFDSVTTKEIVRFLIPTALGCLSYVLATLVARFISPVPRHIYIGRLVFLAVFIVLVWVLYLPSAAIAFSGSQERYAALGGEARGMGTFYGMHTTWIWCVLALLKRPKTRHENAA
jgi:MFS superfamily sulfate permease-like transporter